MTLSEQAWFKSSYSDGDVGGECVEVAVSWRKSSYSDSDGSQCVEVSRTPHTVHLRDSKRKDGPHLSIPATAWADFIRYVPEV